jgi:hypothetical protein
MRIAHFVYLIIKNLPLMLNFIRKREIIIVNFWMCENMRIFLSYMPF